MASRSGGRSSIRTTTESGPVRGSPAGTPLWQGVWGMCPQSQSPPTPESPTRAPPPPRWPPESDRCIFSIHSWLVPEPVAQFRQVQRGRDWEQWAGNGLVPAPALTLCKLLLKPIAAKTCLLWPQDGSQGSVTDQLVRVLDSRVSSSTCLYLLQPKTVWRTAHYRVPGLLNKHANQLPSSDR